VSLSGQEYCRYEQGAGEALLRTSVLLHLSKYKKVNTAGMNGRSRKFAHLTSAMTLKQGLWGVVA